MRYRDGALFTPCAIGILRHLLCVLSGCALSGITVNLLCAIAPCANGTLPGSGAVGTVRRPSTSTDTRGDVCISSCLHGMSSEMLFSLFSLTFSEFKNGP